LYSSYSNNVMMGTENSRINFAEKKDSLNFANGQNP